MARRSEQRYQAAANDAGGTSNEDSHDNSFRLLTLETRSRTRL
jgi:hypothetical protein